MTFKRGSGFKDSCAWCKRRDSGVRLYRFRWGVDGSVSETETGVRLCPRCSRELDVAIERTSKLLRDARDG